MLEVPTQEFPKLAYACRDEKHESSPLVLCVDDEPHVLDALARVLRSHGCRVHGVTNGKEALDLLASYPVDVIICDEKMPGMTGTETLRRAKVVSPLTTRIMLTGHYRNPDVVVGAVNEGEIYRLVTKPWGEQDIRKVVIDALVKRFRS